MERFADSAQGAPYHAGLVDLRARYRAHGHVDYFEMMAVVGGEGRMLISSGGRAPMMQRLEPGQLFLIRPLDRHSLAGHGAGGVQFYNVAFPAAGWLAFTDLAGIESGWSTSGPPPVVRLDRDDELAHAPFAAALERYMNAPTTLDLMRFWLDTAPVLFPPRKRAEAGSGAPAWLLGAVSQMREEGNLRAGLPRLQNLAYVTPAHLSRTVRQYFGMTPTDLVTELRVRHAGMLLSTTLDSVGTIAQRCGFASQSYFSNTFRRANLVSPREYRLGSLGGFLGAPR
ncbi:MAG: transcriptional regulator, AraC family [Rhodoglobus sp.]|nr:transcriptional regulator, AraC family [Rhodoglobus sp.]